MTPVAGDDAADWPKGAHSGKDEDSCLMVDDLEHRGLTQTEWPGGNPNWAPDAHSTTLFGPGVTELTKEKAMSAASSLNRPLCALAEPSVWLLAPSCTILA